MSRFSFRPYVPVAERAAKARKKIKALEKAGEIIRPLGALTNRMQIATSFWGRAWCRHLESYSDYENRLPRGRTYVRNGSVLHLDIAPGRIQALVQGSELYSQTIRIDPLPPKKWRAIQTRCRGGIGSLIELLRGTISEEIMAIVTDKKDGLFPDPSEIHFNCSCPDWADMCKHIAAVLYGVGARLDSAPELLFKLRGVDHTELISAADVVPALDRTPRNPRRRTLAPESVAAVFGVDLDHTDPPAPPATSTKPAKIKKSPAPKPSRSRKTPAKSTKPRRSMKTTRRRRGT